MVRPPDGGRSRTRRPRNADGIVALTGGPFRINDALELLAAGRGRRLLITGVNPVDAAGRNFPADAGASALVRLLRRYRPFRHNTIGNAVETRRWVKARGFQSLIVVTANYHMPRAMAELAHELPDVALVPYPVISDRVRVETWWENPETARLLFLEYLKYIVAKVRMWIPLSFE